MARRKRRREIGHITSAENAKVSESIDHAIDGCVRTYGKNDKEYKACIQGVGMVVSELMTKGFDTHAKGKMYGKRKKSR